MGSKKAREREYARRRYAKQVARMTKAQRRHRRNQMVALIAVAAVVVGGITAGLLSLRGGNDKATVADTPAAGLPCNRPVPATTGLPTAAPDPAAAEGRTWTGTIDLCQDGIYGAPIAGTLQVELDGAAAPHAVANFVQLAQAGFYDGLTCHRLATSISALQCGDPNGDGSGGPGYSFGPVENAPTGDLCSSQPDPTDATAEVTMCTYTAGTIAMARVADDGSSMGSQFFVVYADTTIPSDTAGGYTVLGHVTSGLDVVQQIAAMGTLTANSQTPASTVTIQKVETQ